MWTKKLSTGVLRILTPLGPRYLKPSLTQRVYLLWAFRHFEKLPLQVLNRRQQRLIQTQLLTLNNSAEFGNSAGAITNLVTKSGTNQFHGSGWEYLRNDALDANPFFANHDPDPANRTKTPLRLNQFGATLGGPVRKDKFFFF